MTTGDIKSCSVLIENNDGEIFVGKGSDRILIGMIAAYIKFVKVDKNNVHEVDIKELL